MATKKQKREAGEAKAQVKEEQDRLRAGEFLKHEQERRAKVKSAKERRLAEQKRSAVTKDAVKKIHHG